MKSKSIVYYSLILLGIVHPFLWGISITNHSPEKNDRFGGGGENFIGYRYDFSGVGISSNGRWATMISNNVFITSSHYYPSTNSNITFWETNDKDGNSVEIGVSDKYYKIGSTDIYLGVLDKALPDNYSIYSITEGFKSQFGQNNQVFLLGSSSSFSVGEARINLDSSGYQKTGSNKGQAFYTAENTSDSLADTLLRIGDSGAPVFLFDGRGSMTLLGNNWFIGSTTQNGQNYYVNVLTDLSPYSDQINNFVVRNAVAIPEPTTILGVLPIVALGFFRFWRNRSQKG